MTIATSIILCGTASFMCRHDRPNASGRKAANTICVRNPPSVKMIDAQRPQFLIFHRPIPKMTHNNEISINSITNFTSKLPSKTVRVTARNPMAPPTTYRNAKSVNPTGRRISGSFRTKNEVRRTRVFIEHTESSSAKCWKPTKYSSGRSKRSSSRLLGSETLANSSWWVSRRDCAPETPA